MIRIGSLFSGIGLFELGLLWACTAAGLDAEVVYQVEIDPFCRGVLARHYPHAKRFDDVTKVRGADLDAVDVLCGGWPCQGFSLAGEGRALDDERSGLWRDFARIIGETRPRIVCLENVSALIARGLDVVVEDLERLGYDVEAATVRASDVGAPHRRERIFILAIRRAGLAFAASERRGPGAHVEPERRGHAGTELAGGDQEGSDGRVADTDGERREGLATIDGANRGLDEQRRDDLAGRGPGMADTDSEPVRLDEQRQPRRRTRTLRDGGNAIARHDRESGRGHAQPRVGGSSDGRAPWVVRWPARPGDAPAFWEPPRAVTAYSPTRNARLHALGNAIVPQLVALRFGPRVVEILRGDA